MFSLGVGLPEGRNQRHYMKSRFQYALFQIDVEDSSKVVSFWSSIGDFGNVEAFFEIELKA